MDNKNLIIIGVICLVICILAGAIFGILTNTVKYERIELAPNSTSIEIPTDNSSYFGEVNDTGVKMWTFKQGCLMSYNSEEAINARGLYGLGGAVGFKEIFDLIWNHFEKRENIDGYDVYTIDCEKLGIEGRGLVYCIILNNNETHDNIIIATDNKDITLHIAKSVEYKASNTTNTNITNSNSSNSNSSNSQNGLIPVTYDDGSVGYFHAGEVISLPDGYYRVNSDGSLTKVANDSYSSDSSSDSSDNSYTESTTDSQSNSYAESSQSSNVETSIDSYSYDFD